MGAPKLLANPLCENPFYVLSVSPRDDRHRIVEAAEERALFLDAELCAKARSDLTNPRTRLAAEVAWLTAVSPRRAGELIAFVRDTPQEVPGLRGMTPLCHANLIGASLYVLRPEADPESWISAILRLGEVIDQVGCDRVLSDINADRFVAGFPEIHALKMVEDAVSERRRSLRDSIRDALDRLPSAKLCQVVTAVVETATNKGESPAPALIDELVDVYALQTQHFLECEAASVRVCIERVEKAARAGNDDGIQSGLDKLGIVLRNWDRVAQPIQLSTKSRGIRHELSHTLAVEIRSLGIGLFNEHEKLDVAQQVTKLLQEVFEEIPDVAERLEQDAEAIEGLFATRDRMVSEAREWERKITYRAEVGTIFKTILSISPEGLQWGSIFIPLNEVKAVRWGGTRHSVNGIPTGTSYSIYFAGLKQSVVVDTRKSEVYKNFIDRFWQAIGVRLLTELLSELREGSRRRFGETTVDDEGMVLIRRHVFRSDEEVPCKWHELVIWNADGSFCVAKKEDKKVSIALPYLTVDNTHILEAAMRMIWKRGGRRLSDLLSS